MASAGFKPDWAMFGKNVGPSRKFSDSNAQKVTMNSALQFNFLILRTESPRPANVVLHQANFSMSQHATNRRKCHAALLSDIRWPVGAPFCKAPVRPNMPNVNDQSPASNHKNMKHLNNSIV